MAITQSRSRGCCLRFKLGHLVIFNLFFVILKIELAVTIVVQLNESLMLTATHITSNPEDTLHLDKNRFQDPIQGVTEPRQTQPILNPLNLQPRVVENFSQIAIYNLCGVARVCLPAVKVAHGHRYHESHFTRGEAKHLLARFKMQSLVVALHQAVCNTGNEVESDT